MSQVVVVQGGNFPQTGANQTRASATELLASFIGGEDRPESKTRAGKHLDRSVKEFNSIAWRFNRQTQDITLVADTKTYTLNTNFRSPLTAMLINSSSVTVRHIHWITYEDWILLKSDQTAGGSQPNLYTARNIHNTGLVEFDPFPTGTLSFPKVRLHYFSRIALATGQLDKLNVPGEVDEAIFQLAVAKLIHAEKGIKSAEGDYALAKRMRLDVQNSHRDWGEMTGWGAEGTY